MGARLGASERVRGARRAVAVVAACALVAACSAGQDAPQDVSVSLDFPSTAAAVASDGVDLQVFEAAGTSCLDVVVKRKTNQPLPPPLARTTGTPCDFAAGKVGAFSLGYGKRIFLAVAQRGGEDLLIGCSLQGIGDAKATVVLPMTTANYQLAIPDTSCPRLSAKCSGSCK